MSDPTASRVVSEHRQAGQKEKTKTTPTEAAEASLELFLGQGLSGKHQAKNGRAARRSVQSQAKAHDQPGRRGSDIQRAPG